MEVRGWVGKNEEQHPFCLIAKGVDLSLLHAELAETKSFCHDGEDKSVCDTAKASFASDAWNG